MSSGDERRTARDEMNSILAAESADASYEDLLRHLAFHRLVQRGLGDLGERRFTSAEIRRRLDTWRTVS